MRASNSCTPRSGGRFPGSYATLRSVMTRLADRSGAEGAGPSWGLPGGGAPGKAKMADRSGAVFALFLCAVLGATSASRAQDAGAAAELGAPQPQRIAVLMLPIGEVDPAMADA